MRRKSSLALYFAAGLAVVAGSGALAWWKLVPDEEPPPASAEKSYEDIDREKYEKWMQDLGYTE